MHLYLYARGVKQQLSIWEMFMQSAFWAWKRKDLKINKETITLVQGGLRPTIFGAYEYIFPEECLVDVLASLEITYNNYIGTDKTLMNKARMALLRKMFGASAIPKEVFKKAEKTPTSYTLDCCGRGLSSLRVSGVALHIIGIKTDEREKKENWGFEQEML